MLKVINCFEIVIHLHDIHSFVVRRIICKVELSLSECLPIIIIQNKNAIVKLGIYYFLFRFWFAARLKPDLTAILVVIKLQHLQVDNSPLCVPS